jgi:hypothetical protein
VILSSAGDTDVDVKECYKNNITRLKFRRLRPVFLVYLVNSLGLLKQIEYLSRLYNSYIVV